MKRNISSLVIRILLLPFSLNAQRITPDPNIKLPIEEKIALYFAIFGDGRYTQGTSRFASYIVREFYTDVIPYLKDYLQGAEYFGYVGEPKDVRLELISYVLSSLQTYSDPVYADAVEPYTLDKDVVQWFVDEYKSRLDANIWVTKVLDNIVISGEADLTSIAGYFDMNIYGHPCLWNDGKPMVSEIKSYYE